MQVQPTARSPPHTQPTARAHEALTGARARRCDAVAVRRYSPYGCVPGWSS
jgi:hypothetical protein